MRNRIGLFIAVGLGVCLTVVTARGQAREVYLEVNHQVDVMVPARDGV